MTELRPVIGVPGEVVDTIAGLRAAVGDVVLVGGWAVHCRLAMGRSRARPTSDVDVLLGEESRPAKAALAAATAVQDDPSHPCRLSGLPLLVDLLADGPDDAVVVDEDGLSLLVPPFAGLLGRAWEEVVLDADGARTSCRLPLAGALFAAKVGNLALELRPPEKRASDGEDAVRLLETFGALAVAADVRSATALEVRRLRTLLDQIGAGGLSAQARRSGHDPDPDRLRLAVEAVASRLARAGAA